MAISAYFEGTATPHSADRGAERVARRKLRLAVHGSAPTGRIEVLIHNISATGLLVECARPLAVGDEIAVNLPHSGASSAVVIWSSRTLYGCRFVQPVSAATLSAAQLRSVVAPAAPPMPAPGRPDSPAEASASRPSGESLGARLLRLRLARQLTQAQLAEHLCVSEPAISAWEQDKSRPRAGRMEALCALLGVPMAELIGQRSGPSLDEIVAESRSRIAHAAGTTPDKVRIAIEL